MSGLTVNDPIKLEQVLRSSKIIPGDTLYLRGGTYAGNWIANIGGTLEAPVVIKPYDLEPVVIDGTFTFGMSHLKVMDIEFTNSNSDRTLWDSGITMHPQGSWLIGCDIHDMHSDGVNWMNSGIGGVVECKIANCGSLAPNGPPHYGHAIYTHNNGGGARLIARNLLLDQIGKYTIHIYSASSNYLRDYTCEDNVIWGDPVHTGGGSGLVNFIYRRNIQHGDYAQMGRYSSQPNDGGLIQDNLFINLFGYSVQDGFLNLTETGNIVWDGEPAGREGYTVEMKPSNWSQFIPFNLSERWAGIQCTITDGMFNAEIVIA